MKKIVILTALIAVSIMSVYAENPFKARTCTSTDGVELNYRALEPETIKPKEKYPLVIFMHGAGERGNDNELQLVHGSQMFLNPVNREKYPAFVIFPQCPKDKYWAFTKRPESFFTMETEDEITPILKSVKELIDTYLANPAVDRSRVYIMGLSMGGMATYDLVARYPEIFAAAIPICGAADNENLSKVKGVSWRIYHGDADDVVPVKCSRLAYAALKKGKADVEYFEFPGCNHGSWNPAFTCPDFLEWLFKQKKSRKYLR